ncbi:hypothetical protein [Shewanella baltica]|uniref:hypothetical protein n=1 Tax=Shewanella baltica TaxID=62322 RepID=UPI0039AEA52E
MGDNATELSAAIEKLAQLNTKLQQAERAYDQALTHAANYLGNDDEIEEHRDNLAKSALDDVMRIREMIANQAELIKMLMTAKS